uniref:Uncharacterized protein n=1 Tax=Lactuca sativa TaxID=4236 RepID=A0A9R1XU57_LACSA|nr:hypothetical protein LSAT_V11C200094080 [Lactuca sativa]
MLCSLYRAQPPNLGFSPLSAYSPSPSSDSPSWLLNTRPKSRPYSPSPSHGLAEFPFPIYSFSPSTLLFDILGCYNPNHHAQPSCFHLNMLFRWVGLRRKGRGHTMNLVPMGINCPRSGLLLNVENARTNGIIHELVKIKVTLMTKEPEVQEERSEDGVVVVKC